VKWWLIGLCVFGAYVVIPVFVYWLRHRPYNLRRGTQHIVFAGLLGHIVLVMIAVLVWVFW
jgi:hypothetical protein